ncbi:MAG: LuxR C-terminal-related transcriptional regulator [Thermomicrobiales bacterium]
MDRAVRSDPGRAPRSPPARPGRIAGGCGGRPPEVTERSWAVLSRLAAGQPASQIAADLGLSRQRVYQIVANVRRKLGDNARPT